MSGSNLDISFFAGGGHMGELIRARDWSKTTLGPAESWPQSLRTALSICLNSNFPILIWWGRDLVMLYNDAYRPILGSLKHPHALGQPGRECWPEIWPIFGPMLEGVLDNGAATWSEDQLLLLDRNGYLEECYFTLSYSPIRTESGEVGGVFSAVTETTWRVLSERRNRVLGELAEQTAGATTSELVVTVSAKVLDRASADIPFALLYLLDGSDHYARLAGEAGFGDTAIPLPQIIDLETPTAATSPVARAAQTGTLTRIDNPTALWGALPTGTSNEPPTAALVLPIFGSSGATPVGLLVAGASTQHALDDEYVQFFLHLAERIATAISAARAYEEERRRAESLAEIDRAKTVFFSNVSHEFRTPLALMLGMAEDLQDDPEAVNPAAREQIEVIHRSSQRLLKLVNTLLDFSRIESGRIQACYEPTDLAALTTSLASMFRTATDRAHLPLLIDCPPLPEPVFVDRQMWEKILLNLLSNAFKYTLEGEITVRMECRDNEAVLTVSDTGVGIPKDEMRNLFTRFYRIPGSRGRTHEGSGIGLSLAMELVRLHHGTIEADSIEGKGTTFRVKIPLGSSHLPAGRIGVKGTHTSTAISARTFVDEALTWIPNEPDSADDTEAAPGIEHITPPEFGSPHTGPLAGARIVFADDNADLRRYVSGLLSRSGGEVIVATDGEVAIKAIRSVRPDLVLTDVMMPRLDGFGLLAAIRADENLKTLPVIMLSARAGEEARIEALNAGATDYIVKPFRSRELVARVESQINIGRIRDDAFRREQALLAETESILSSISLGFMAVDRDWRITYINPAGERLAGIPRERLLGKTNWEAFPETIGKPVEKELRRAMARRAHIQFEDHHEPAGLWLETDVFPLSDGGLAFYSRDISDRKRAEESLRESEERFRVMADGIAQIIWVTDEHGRMQFVNRAFTEFFGVTLETLQTDGWEPLVHPDDRDTYTAAYAEALRERKPFHAEARIRRHDGIWCWVESSGHPRFSADGEFQGIAGSSPDVTDRKIAEAAIRGSEERYRTLFEIQPVGLGIGDLEGRTLAMNSAGLRLHGFASESDMFSALQEYTEVFELRDLEGRILPPSEWPASRAIRGDFVRDFEVVLRNLANGHERVASYTVIPSRNAHGVVARLFYVMQDVTDRRLYEQALRQSEERFRIALQNSPITVAALDRDLRYTWIYNTRHGFSPATVIGKRPDELLPAEDIAELMAFFRYVLETGRAERREISAYNGDQLLEYDLTAEPVRDEHGTITGLNAVFIDISEHKRIQRLLEENRRTISRQLAEIEAIYAQAPVGLCVLDRDLRFLHVNDRIAEINGVPVQAHLGAHVSEIVPGITDLAGRIFQAILASGQPMLNVEVHGETPAQPGVPRDFIQHWLPLTDANGEIFAVNVVIEEVTERKRIEAELRHRTRELEIANEDLQRFGSYLAHDLRAPLRAIHGFAQILAEDFSVELDDEGVELIDRIAEASDRAAEIITDIQRLARLDTGEFLAETIDLGEIAAELIEQLRLREPDRSVEFIRHPDLIARADRRLITIALSNLLDNAWKYTGKTPHACIEFGVRYEADSPVFYIKDNGAGFDPAHIDKLFQPFQRLHAPGEFPGTGLGLTIVRKVISRHNGRVWAESGGSGASVSFTLNL